MELENEKLSFKENVIFKAAYISIKVKEAISKCKGNYQDSEFNVEDEDIMI